MGTDATVVSPVARPTKEETHTGRAQGMDRYLTFTFQKRHVQRHS